MALPTRASVPGPDGNSPRAARTAEKIRILIVDDSVFMRQALSKIFSSDPEITVVDIAKNGKEGVEKALALRPDVVTLDIEMPIMDGLTALSEMRERIKPLPAVLMCSTLTKAGSTETLRALRLGAADFIQKDPQSLGALDEKVRTALLARVKAIAQGVRTRNALTRGDGARPGTGSGQLAAALGSGTARARRPGPVGPVDAVVIGSSTGGPPVLETLIMSLRRGTGLPPIVIAQHMPGLFTLSLAERLNEVAEVPVKHAEQGMRLEPGTVFICPGGKQTQITGRAGSATLTVGDEPVGMLYKPCVNVLFWSAAKVFGGRLLGAICTGMGDDGMLGAQEVVRCGGRIWSQEGSTCVVYGMPKAVVSAGVVSEEYSPEEMGQALASLGITGSGRAPSHPAAA